MDQPKSCRITFSVTESARDSNHQIRTVRGLWCTAWFVLILLYGPVEGIDSRVRKLPSIMMSEYDSEAFQVIDTGSPPKARVFSLLPVARLPRNVLLSCVQIIQAANSFQRPTAVPQQATFSHYRKHLHQSPPNPAGIQTRLLVRLLFRGQCFRTFVESACGRKHRETEIIQIYRYTFVLRSRSFLASLSQITRGIVRRAFANQTLPVRKLRRE